MIDAPMPACRNDRRARRCRGQATANDSGLGAGSGRHRSGEERRHRHAARGSHPVAGRGQGALRDAQRQRQARHLARCLFRCRRSRPGPPTASTRQPALAPSCCPGREVQSPNFIGFRVWADGRELTPEVEIRATLPDGRDIAAGLQEIGGLALVLRSGLYALPDDPQLDAEDAASASARSAPSRSFQIAPIGCRGRPDHLPLDADLRAGRDDRRALQLPAHPGIPDMGGGGAFQPAGWFSIRGAGRRCGECLLHRCRRPANVAQPSRTGAREEAREAAKPEFSDLLGYTLGYVLQTARNWRGPIGTFHLTVKGDPISASPLDQRRADRRHVLLFASASPRRRRR